MQDLVRLSEKGLKNAFSMHLQNLKKVSNMFLRLLKLILSEFYYWFFYFIRYMPGNSGVVLRILIYKNLFASCGKNVYISQGCEIKGVRNITLGSNVQLGFNNLLYASGIGNERIEIGNNVSLNANVMINADRGGSITIGDNVIIGPNVVLRSSNHKFNTTQIPIREQGHESGRIIIKEDVWIGANVVVLPNVTIGKGTVVGAGAVVNKDVEEYSIIGGVPAKVISKRSI